MVINTGSWEFWMVVIILIIAFIWYVSRDREVPQCRNSLDEMCEGENAYREHCRCRARCVIEEIRSPVETVEEKAEIPAATSAAINAKRFKSIGEEMTFRAYEDLVKRPILHNYRPNFLLNPMTGRRLEYDCYDEVNKVAVEYNGIQHYQYPNPFHRNEETFRNLVYRDGIKKQISEEHGIRLITVPYTVDTCDPNENDPTGYKYNSRITREQRYLRIRDFLAAQLQC